MKSLAIPPDFVDTERGNTWLIQEDGYNTNHVAWILLWQNTEPDKPSAYLEVSVTPANYPGFYVGRVDRTSEQLREHIQVKLQGWQVRKCNIPGVVIEDGEIPYVEEEEDNG